MLTPKSTATRDTVSLDGVWRFATSAMTETPWLSPLPGILEAAVPASYNDQFVDAAVRDHVGVVWYQRHVRVPRGWTGERIVLRFDAATHAAAVYVDERLVVEHVGGYTPFEADLTGLVVAGQEFRLTVGVDNRLTQITIPPGTVTTGPDGRAKQSYLHDFYNYGGLARSVRLCSTPLTHLSDITVTTGRGDGDGADADADGSTGWVGYDIQSSGPGETTRAAVTLRDAAGTVVATADGATGTLRVPGATLWQPGAGYLYELEARLIDGDTVVDSYLLPVGIRSVEVRGTEFLINGEPLYFTGFGKHEDSAVRGKGHDNAYLVHDFQLMEWMGANSFRTSHYPYAEEVLEFADRHGMVVIDETAAVGLNLGMLAGLTGQPALPTFGPEGCNDESQAALAQHIRELIARDKNHPSVVMWSLINEPASQEEGAREFFEPLVTLARELDPTRPLTYANVTFASSANDRIADLFDVISLNRYYGWYVATGDLARAEEMLTRDLQSWVDAHDKPIMMTEYGADTEPGLHSVWDSPWTEEYQTAYYEMHARVFDRIPQLVGEQVWNFADFQTSNGIHRVGGNKKGIFTRDRTPKSAAHALRARWREIGTRKPGSAPEPAPDSSTHN